MTEKWKERYLKLASEVSTWSKDPSKQIGAVIVGKNGQIISQGYNGFPKGIHDTKERYEDREQKYKFVVHAEMNAIYNAIHNGSSPAGATLYVTGLPICHECAKAIIQVQIKNVIMNTDPVGTTWEESWKISKEMFDEVGIKYEFLTRG